MTKFTIFRRSRPLLPALSVAVALAGVVGAGPAAAQDDTAGPSVIVDDSALDGAAGASGSAELLPAPAHQPVSHLVTAGKGPVEAATPPETISDETVSAVPTTPIETTEIEGFTVSEETRALPAAGEATPVQAAAPASDEAATATPSPTPEDAPTADTQTAATTAPAAGTDSTGEQTAAKPPIDGMLRLTFEPESKAIPDAAKAQLAPLIEKLNGDYLLRVQVLAYAAGDDDASSHARGISLARALALRDYLTGQGVAIERMDIKALGNAAQEEPVDRVDLVPLEQ